MVACFKIHKESPNHSAPSLLPVLPDSQISIGRCFYICNYMYIPFSILSTNGMYFIKCSVPYFSHSTICLRECCILSAHKGLPHCFMATENSLYGNILIYLTSSQQMGHLGCFQNFAIFNNKAVVKNLYRHYSSQS